MELSDFKEYVQSYAKRPDKEDEIVQAYNDMIMWVALQMPHSGYKFQSYVNTQVGIEDYSLPNNMIHLIHPIRLLLGSDSGDSGYPLEHITKQEYDLIEPNPNRTTPPRGRPSKYTVYSRSLLLTPVPDSNEYIMEINRSKRPVDLAEDTETSNLGSEWDEVLLWGTLERLYAGMGMAEESASFGNKYHAVTTEGDDVPVGMCRKLFEIERDREQKIMGQVQYNDL